MLNQFIVPAAREGQVANMTFVYVHDPLTKRQPSPLARSRPTQATTRPTPPQLHDRKGRRSFTSHRARVGGPISSRGCSKGCSKGCSWLPSSQERHSNPDSNHQANHNVLCLRADLNTTFCLQLSTIPHTVIIIIIKRRSGINPIPPTVIDRD